MTRTHWFGEDVATIDTTLDSLPSRLPVFDRYAFGANRFRDVIVRRSPGDADPLPVGVVSKAYVLVQHADAIRAVTEEIKKAGIDPAAVPARLLISEYGTRMALRATLPSAHAFTPDDGHRMALTFECFNSVDGTVPLFAAVGWFRFVCSNGLVVGNSSATVRQKHSPSLEIGEVSEVLAQGMEDALQDRKSFDQWRSTRIPARDLAKWVDGRFDGKPAQRKEVQPHERSLTQDVPVPGTHAPCDDGYEIAQVLAWVAAQRGNVAQRLQWRGQIRTLMSHLVPALVA